MSPANEQTNEYQRSHSSNTIRHDTSLVDDEDTDIEKRPKSRPGMMSFEARAKYDGWHDAQGMSKQEAMNAYVQLGVETHGPLVEAVLKGE